MDLTEILAILCDLNKSRRDGTDKGLMFQDT